MKHWLRFILIILFSTIFSYLVTYSFQTVLQLQYEIPDADMFLGFWGDTYFFRILASLLGTAIGGFVIGTYLKKGSKIATIIYSVPIVAFWVFVLIYYYRGSIDEFSFFSRYHIIPLTLSLLSVPVAYFGCIVGCGFQDDFERSKSILNIKWYHWLWIFPFLLNQIISVLILIITLLWNSPIDENVITNLIFNFGNTIARFITIAILMGLMTGAAYLYSLLADDETDIKLKWLQILGLVILFDFVYMILIGIRLINM